MASCRSTVQLPNSMTRRVVSPQEVNKCIVHSESLVWALASVTIVGIGAVIGLMARMKEVVHFNEGLIIALRHL